MQTLGGNLEQTTTLMIMVGMGFFLLFGMIITRSVWMFLVFVVLLVVFGRKWGLKKISELRVGDVKVKAHRPVVVPGQSWPFELELVPRKSFRTNGIKVTLLGTETVVSGSGTNETTHEKIICQEEHVLAPPGTFPSGQSNVMSAVVRMPESAAYSFQADSNKIVYSAVVCIDIPSFPDWVEAFDFRVVPAEFISEGKAIDHPGQDEIYEAVVVADDWSHLASLEAAEVAMEVGEKVVDEAAVDETGVATEVDEVVVGEDPNSRYSDIKTLLNDFAGNENGIFELRELVKSSVGRVYEVNVGIDRIVSTFGSTAGSEYSNGKTITGKVLGSDHVVQIFTRTSTNSQIDQLSPGDDWHTLAAVHDWDSLYNRIVLIEVDGDNS